MIQQVTISKFILLFILPLPLSCLPSSSYSSSFLLPFLFLGFSTPSCFSLDGMDFKSGSTSPSFVDYNIHAYLFWLLIFLSRLVVLTSGHLHCGNHRMCTEVQPTFILPTSYICERKIHLPIMTNSF